MEDETQATLMSSDDLQTYENSSVEEFDSKNYEGMQLQLLGASFKSREDLISSTKDVYLVQGYAISIKCLRKGKYVVLGCDRGGHYRNKLNIAAEDRKRKSGSRLINCPFQLRGKKQLDGFWKLKMENNLHNHEPSSDMSGHPLCRQLSEEQTAAIERMTRAGVQTRQILSALRQENANTKAVSRTIANMKFKIKKEKLAGRTPIQALFDELGREVSSRAEGAHAKLKQYLQVSTGDFQKVKERICLAIENDFQEIKSRLSSEKIRTLHDCNILLFKELNTRVSHFAMKELFKQWELVRSGKMSSTCTGQFKTVMGLPCAHMLNGWKENAIPIDAIHSQWRIDNIQFILPGDKINSKAEKLKGLLDTFEEKYQEWPLTQKDKALDVISQLVNEHSSKFSEPEIVSHKGRPQGSMNRRNSSSTKRNLSEFEFVKKTRKCSVCECVGHNSRSCRGKNTMSEYMDCYTPCPIEEENIVSDSYNLSEDFSRNPYFTNEESPGFFDL